MQSEKTPYEILKENYEILKETYALVIWLKSVYKQDAERKGKEIELYKQGMPSFIEDSFIDFQKAKDYEKLNFLELQMLN